MNIHPEETRQVGVDCGSLEDDVVDDGGGKKCWNL